MFRSSFRLLALPCLIFLTAITSGGCANPAGPAWKDPPDKYQLWTTAGEDERIATLRQDLTRTCPRADPAEVEAVAGAAVRFGERVRYEYGLFRPVEFNNILIQLGLKRRGLCFQLADDLFCRLRVMDLKTLDLHEGQAAVGDLIEEHNCVVVTDKGQPFHTGMLLDAWRYAGKLRWMSVIEDYQHDWKERPTLPAPTVVVADYHAPPTSVAPPPAVPQRLMILPEPQERGACPCVPATRLGP